MAFRNPVYPSSFPDPFVLKYRGEYWGYCTGFQPDGRVFGILHSTDLVHWDFSGGAMDPLPGGHTCYWAPEVTYEDDGTFLMYYSVGNEENMVIRVAKAAHPAGPFVDAGVALTKQPFAIDAHVFKDDDGSRYLFYATDFLDHQFIGTGTVADRMRDPLTLDQHPEPVTRARYDWQVYDPKRESKGGVRWHTVEGPFVLKYKSRYYEMFSGGNWQNITYGVSFAESDAVLPGHEWQQNADGVKIYPILRTIPERVVGPGHNSVVMGPDNRQLYCIYHVWHRDERVLAIDKLDFTGTGLVVLGPTTSEQSGPNKPILKTLWDETLPTSTESTLEEGSNRTISLGGFSSLVEFWFALEEEAALRVVFDDRPGREFSISLVAGESVRPGVWVRARIEIDGTYFNIRIGDSILKQDGIMPAKADALRFEARGGDVRVSPIEITRGFEDLCDGHPGNTMLNERMWEIGGGAWDLNDRLELTARSEGATLATISKKLGDIVNYEWVVNLKLVRDSGSSDTAADPGATLYLGDPSEHVAISLRAHAGRGQITYERSGPSLAVPGADAPLLNFEPAQGADPFEFLQLRIRKMKGRLGLMMGRVPVIELNCAELAPRIAIGVKGGAVFDMIRITELIEEE